ncbi:MAG TPA: tetratricopeptide repeat protein [Acidobacteriota bacterium]|nr:tetratricopeptide repeat protein [Acidobacteriota bacterium]
MNPPKTPLENPTTQTQVTPNTDYNKGYLQYRKGDQNKARQEFQKVLRKNPNYYPAFLGIGYTYIAENNLDAAERYIRGALDINSDYIQGHYALAVVLEQQVKYQEALQEWAEIQRINPEYPGLDQSQKILRLKATEFLLTQAREETKNNPERGIELYREAQKFAPEISQIPLEIATIQIKQGKCSEGITLLEQSGEQLSDDPEIQLAYAECLSEVDEYQKALETYEKVNLIAPSTEIQQHIDDLKKILAFRAMPEEYQIIGQTSELNRAQLAALIFTNLKFLEKYGSSGSVIVVDAFDHWAKNHIRKAVDLGMMDVFPNRTFQPSRWISKLELTRAAARIMEILESNEGKKIPIQEESASMIIPDVSASSIYYSMVNKTIAAGVISLDADGRFHMNRPVSGAEAMSVINRLQVLSE